MVTSFSRSSGQAKARGVERLSLALVGLLFTQHCMRLHTTVHSLSTTACSCGFLSHFFIVSQINLYALHEGYVSYYRVSWAVGLFTLY